MGSPAPPAYFDELVFRHNRRGTPIAAFQALLGLGATRPPTTYREITSRAARPQTEPTGYASDE
ncbi:MAG: hypothetical protein JSS68_06680 [Actinobacteria bacterium]|nr:hypothetical protein [Actinomycetota bacterium]